MAKIIARQGKDIAELKKRIKVLEDRLSQNSGNSSKSPSTDWLKKREILGKKQAGLPVDKKGIRDII